MINVTRSSMPSFEEYCNEIKELWDSHWLTNMGVKHQMFQQLLEARLGVPYVTLYTNGHLALENVLAACHFPQGGEVITTPFTFASTTHAIVRNGLVPVFCDIRQDDYTLDASKLEALVSERTVAILPVHVYGNMCDVEAIDAVAKRHGLKVIYDAAHAFGVTLNGVSSACFGDGSIYSFHATKVFNTIEGGAVCYHDDSWEPLLNDLKNFGIRGMEEVAYIGGNAKMSEFQAAMGICNLRHLDDEIAKRRRVRQVYDELLEGVDGICLCKPQPGVKTNYAYLPVVFDGYKYNRDQVYDILASRQIYARKYFYPLTNGFAAYADYPTADVSLTPVARDISSKVLTLPIYADLPLDTVTQICQLILE